MITPFCLCRSKNGMLVKVVQKTDLLSLSLFGSQYKGGTKPMNSLYHASPIAGIKILEPRISTHGDPRVYFSIKRENTLVYLSNAIEKHCRQTGFLYNGTWQKWGTYGFTSDHRLRLEEYYPNALQETYEGVSAYIYKALPNEKTQVLTGIADAFYSCDPMEVVDCEFIKDAYAEIMQVYEEGKIDIIGYEEWTEKQRESHRRMIATEYEAIDKHPEYKYFLECKFPWLKK